MRISRSFLAAAAVSLLAVSPAIGQSQFQLSSRRVEISENGTVLNDLIITPSYEILYHPLPGWQKTVDPQKKTITFVSAASKSSLSVEFIFTGGPQDPPQEVKHADVRTEILADSPQAKILEEHPCYTNGLSGPAIDFVEVKQRSFRFTTRLAIVPFAGGTMRLKLSSPSESFADLHPHWSGFVSSLTFLPKAAGQRQTGRN